MRPSLPVLSVWLFGLGVCLLRGEDRPDRPAPPARPIPAFEGFPRDKPLPITLAVDARCLEQMTRRDQQDQLLDWLLYLVVSQAGLSTEEFNQALFDVPAVRHDFLRRLGRPEFGPVRSCLVGSGVVALVPAGTTEERHDALAHVADRHRAHLAGAAERVFVFEYTLDTARQRAFLTRRSDVDGKELLSERFGYHEAEVHSARELAEFLGTVDDLTFADAGGRALRLGGRKWRGREARRVRPEQVAALWQAQVGIERKREAAEKAVRVGQEVLHRKFQGELDGFRAWHERQLKELGLVGPEGEFGRGHWLDELRQERELRQQQNAYNQKARALQTGYDHEARRLFRSLMETRRREFLVAQCGFSLDPAVDYEGLAKAFKEAEPALGALLKENKPPLDAEDLAAAKQGLAKRDELPLLLLLDRLRKSDSAAGQLVAELLSEKLQKFRFQAARYDGDLQGTEAGMVLFYTDLLAKLWSLNYEDSVPGKAVEDFVSKTGGGTAPFYRQETVAFPGTRLWFGPEEAAFQLADGRKQIFFASRATRLFSASSSPLQPGAEVPTNYAAGRMLGWWDDHYDEVAAYEPEYQRLDQLMKWSLVQGMVRAARRSELLALLDEVPVDRTAWFPDWVRRQNGLRFDRWDKVGFFPRGYKGTSTETMPILGSRPFRDYGEKEATWVIRGGVSLGNPKELEARSLTSTEVPRLARRPALDYKRSTRRTFFFRGTTHRLQAAGAGRSLLVSEAAEGQRLRGSFAELATRQSGREVDTRDGRLTVLTRAGGVGVGRLEVRTAPGGFTLSWTSGDLEAGIALARTLSRSEDISAALARSRHVEKHEERGGRYRVKLHGSDRPLGMALDTNPPASVPKGWQARVADTTPGARTFNLAWDEGPGKE